MYTRAPQAERRPNRSSDRPNGSAKKLRCQHQSYPAVAIEIDDSTCAAIKRVRGVTALAMFSAPTASPMRRAEGETVSIAYTRVPAIDRAWVRTASGLSLSLGQRHRPSLCLTSGIHT